MLVFNLVDLSQTKSLPNTHINNFYVVIPNKNSRKVLKFTIWKKEKFPDRLCENASQQIIPKNFQVKLVGTRSLVRVVVSQGLQRSPTMRVKLNFQGEWGLVCSAIHDKKETSIFLELEISLLQVIYFYFPNDFSKKKLLRERNFVGMLFIYGKNVMIV